MPSRDEVARVLLIAGLIFGCVYCALALALVQMRHLLGVGRKEDERGVVGPRTDEEARVVMRLASAAVNQQGLALKREEVSALGLYLKHVEHLAGERLKSEWREWGGVDP